jgi:hypothetical protein
VRRHQSQLAPHRLASATPLNGRAINNRRAPTPDPHPTEGDEVSKKNGIVIEVGQYYAPGTLQAECCGKPMTHVGDGIYECLACISCHVIMVRGVIQKVGRCSRHGG